MNLLPLQHYCRPVIKDDEDLLKLFEKLPDYLICEDKVDQTAAVLQVKRDNKRWKTFAKEVSTYV